MSGGTIREVVGLSVFVFVFTYLFIGARKICRSKIVKNISKTAIILICGIIVVGRTTNTVMAINNRQNENPIYIEELGGYFTELGDSIVDAKNRIGDSKIFSTYATAIETATNQFQPSGIDYIIHVLGNKQREEYIENFKKGEFDYVVTTDKDYHRWRYWIKNANWFFYKELYKDYIPEFSTEYNVFWKKQAKEKVSENANIKIETKDLSTKKIRVETENPNFDGVASVKISYKSHFKKDFWKKLIINRYVFVNDISGKSLTESTHVDYNIPNKSEEYYIPITIINGVGELEISSYPFDDTTFELDNAEISELFDVNFKYCVASRNHNIFGNTLYIDNSKENQIILEDAEAIKIGDIQEEISEISKDDNFIKLRIDKNIENFAYPNYFEVINKGE